jgi:2-keto-3-deoxy-6-phosphogluconate aldolase
MRLPLILRSRTKATLKATELVAYTLPDISIGAGSVRSTDQITALRERGGKICGQSGQFSKSDLAG